MPEIELTRAEQVALKARAHHLEPVVRLGAAGLTEAVLKEIDRALTAHALIKIRLPGDDREDRVKTIERIADQLDAGRVAVIGKMLVLYRQPEEAAPVEPPASGRRATRDPAGSRPAGRPGARPGGRPAPASKGATQRRRRA
jgi:putative YhbY family RNA-binding protein